MQQQSGMPSIYPVACHTDNIGPGSVFVAIRGTHIDGAAYICEAIKRGAREIIIDHETVFDASTADCIKAANVLVSRVTNTREALALRSAQANGNPAQQLTIIGVTGTKGKTTSCYLLEHIFKTAGYRTALSTTVTTRILDTEWRSPLTTPQPDYLQVFLRACVEQAVAMVIMEVSAQALSCHRLDGIFFAGILWTNFSHEHGEFYATMDDYLAAKSLIFDHRLPDCKSWINSDDPNLAELHERYAGISSFSMHDAHATVHGTCTAATQAGLEFTATMPGNSSCHSTVPALIGDFNVYNCLGAAALAQSFAISCKVIQQAYQTFVKVPGRLERYRLPNGATAFIDYAHNPSSYTAVLQLLATYTDHLIILAAAGGDRDATKRPIMGAIAAKYGQIVIITSDNPRSEDPEAIADQVMAGIPDNHTSQIMRVIDRELAIRAAYAVSRPGSIIALLGKGPDEYQILGSVTLPFSERAILLALSHKKRQV